MADRTELLGDLVARDVLRPVIEVNGCGFCAVPRGHRTRSFYCSRCLELRERHGEALDSLEPVAFSRDDEPLLALVRQWKDWRGSGDDPRPTEMYGRPLAAVLSAYLQAHADEFGLDDDATVVTYVPTTSMIIDRCAGVAEDEGWYMPQIFEGGESEEPGLRHRFLSGDQRVARSPDSWSVSVPVSGRQVVLLDDLYTTGGSCHSFAAALKTAGATEVAGVALVRDIMGQVYEHQLAYRRQTETLKWGPENRRLGTWRI